MNIVTQIQKTATLLIILLFSTLSFGQVLEQIVRGKIVDTDSQSPLIGTEVIVVGSDPLMGTTTDLDGQFRFDNVPIGRVSLLITYLGYEETFIPDIIVNSGKEVVLAVSMTESVVKMKEVVVIANVEKGKAVNDMALISARSISAEETSRYPGSLNDPSRILSNFAGVVNSPDGGNDLIVRGNSPKYVQWRLEGIEITNPNHFGDQSGVGGGISTLNNNMMGTSDFYSGAFAPQYGQALSGVYDVKLRSGNNEKFESVFGFGLLGTDFTLEGPIKKNYGGSFLVNYRYSTAQLIDELGLLGEITGVPKFQDASFKVVLPTKFFGTFKMIGLGGKSNLFFEDVTPALWVLPGNDVADYGIREDFDKNANLFNLGVSHSISISENSYLQTNISYARDEIKDQVIEASVINFFDDQGVFERDSVISSQENYKSAIQRSNYQIGTVYNNKISSQHKLQIGSQYSVTSMVNSQSNLQSGNRQFLVDFDENVGVISNFLSWQYKFNDDITVVSGVHNMNVLFNSKSTIEPRLAMNWKLSNRDAFHVGYGKHSTIESLHNYFAKVEYGAGNFIEPNRDLDVLKADHFVIGYDRKIGEQINAKVEFYYQHLYDIPVENLDTSYYSTINEGLDFRYVDLVNEGTGTNYGLELTVERNFNNGYYFLANGSLYQSKYKALDGIERNTQYNGNYIANILCGKEFSNLGKRNNQTLNLNAKIFFSGGRKILSLLRDEDGELAVDPAANRYWDYDNAYTRKLDDIYTVTISASYKWNRMKATHELYLTLDNVTNSKRRITEYYDERESDNIGNDTQFGLFPNLQYRVYF